MSNCGLIFNFCHLSNNIFQPKYTTIKNLSSLLLIFNINTKEVRHRLVVTPIILQFVSSTMSIITFCFSSQNNSNYFEILEFQPFDNALSLPFPLYKSYPIRMTISLFLFCTLVYGLQLRTVIFAYLLAPETRMGPINSLIWMDQFTGSIGGLSIMLRIILILLPVPINDILDGDYCSWMDMPGRFYVVGSITWSSFIAIYRENKKTKLKPNGSRS